MKNLFLFLALLAQVAVAAQEKAKFGTIVCPSVPDTARVTENTIHAKVDTRALFPGGLAAFQDFFDKNYKNRVAVNASGKKDRVFVSFVIEKDGSLSGAKVRRNTGSHSVNDTIIRVVQMSPAWTPALKGGKTVRSSVTIPLLVEL